jgi:hypothetical protein
MTAMDMSSRFGRTASAALGVSALLLTVGCAQDRGGAPVLSAAPGPASQPVVVSCEPHQRALVRPAVVNGVAVSQVECVSAASAQFGGQPAAGLVPAQQPVYRQVSAAQPAYEELGDARVLPVSTARPVPTRQVVYDREPVRQTRTVKKSAIIIGSSAGVGAGVGAAVGGKKGALIGAAIGGGSAAIWDQVTRRR